MPGILSKCRGNNIGSNDSSSIGRVPTMCQPDAEGPSVLCAVAESSRETSNSFRIAKHENVTIPRAGFLIMADSVV